MPQTRRSSKGLPEASKFLKNCTSRTDQKRDLNLSRGKSSLVNSWVCIVQRLREIKIWIGFNPGRTIIWILNFPASKAAASINVFEASDTGFTFLASPPLYVSAGKRESSNFCLEWSKTFQILLSLDLLIISDWIGTGLKKLLTLRFSFQNQNVNFSFEKTCVHFLL